MSKFSKKQGKGTPAISTASLPDIIFILLFFFMVVTVLREVTKKVDNQLPTATELTKLQQKSLVKSIYIGKPLADYQKKYGTAPRIQLNDAFGELTQIASFVEAERNTITEDRRNAMTINLMVDVKTKMGIVSDVKQELRKADALKINYAALTPGD